MPSKISICIFVCVTLLVVQNSVAKSLIPIKCGYACKEQLDLDTGDGYYASGSAISSQFLAPDGSVVTNSKETRISSDGIKQTFHELKKEADRFVQTGQGGPNIHNQLGKIEFPHFQQPVLVPYVDSYSSQSTKDHGLENKLIHSLSPSVNSQYTQVQTQNSAHVHSNPQITCDICASHTGSGHLENTASYNTIVGNVAPVSEVHSSYQKSESSSSQKNSSYPAPFSNLKPNTFTTTYIDFNGANKNTINNGAGSESHVSYQERGSGQIKSEERIQHTYGGGPVAYPSRVVVSVNQPSGVVNSHSYEKQQSSSHVQTANQPVVFPVSASAQQAEAELSKQHQSNVFLPAQGVSVDLDQHPSSYQSSHSYYSSSSSSSKSVSSSDSASPVVVHQTPIKYSANNGYSSSSSSSSSSGSSYLQNIPSEVHITDGQKIHGVSSSIYDQETRGDLIQSNPNAETLCTICRPVSISSPTHKNTYGVATSYSSQSSTINGKTTENREAAVSVNDNGKVDSYRVKT